MMRLSPPGHQRLTQATSLEVAYGGGEANVAATLAGLGQPAAHVTCFPDNELGRAAAQSFRRLGVDMGHTVFRGPRLGLYLPRSRGLAAGQPGMLRPHRLGLRRSSTRPHFNWEDILEDARLAALDGHHGRHFGRRGPRPPARPLPPPGPGASPCRPT